MLIIGAAVEPLRLITGEPESAAAWWPWATAAIVAVACVVIAVTLWRLRWSRLSVDERALRHMASACGLARDEIEAVREGAKLLGIAPAGLLLSDTALARVARLADEPRADNTAMTAPTARIAPGTPRRPRSVNTTA